MDPIRDVPHAGFVALDSSAARDLLAVIERGMADLTPPLHDTRASYPPEWVGMAPKLNRAQRRGGR